MMRPLSSFATKICSITNRCLATDAIAVVLSVVLSTAIAVAGQDKTHRFGDPQIWQWAPSRTYHVENYKLELHFDEPKGEVFGDEVVMLRPFQPHFQKFYLNSSELTIDAVTLQQDGAAVSHDSLLTAGSWPTVKVKLCVAFGVTPFCAVNVIG